MHPQILLRVVKYQIPPRKLSWLSRKNELTAMKAQASLPFQALQRLHIHSDSPILSGQKSTECATPASWKVLQKNPEEYDRNRVGKYTPYFQGNIKEISETLDPLHYLARCRRYQDEEIFRFKERHVWRPDAYSRHPSAVFLPTKLCSLGNAATN